MIRILKITGLIFALVAIVMSATKFYQLALIPSILAVVIGGIMFYLSKKARVDTKSVQYISLLIFMTIIMSIYQNLIGAQKQIPPQELPNFDFPELDSTKANQEIE